MKTFAAVIMLLIVCRAASAQQGSASAQQAPRDPYAEQLVATLLAPGPSSSFQGPVSSFQEKAVNRLGDRISIGIVRHAGEHPPQTPQEVARMLELVRMAFAAPSIIASPADAEPKATNLLLSYLRCLSYSKNLIDDIDATRTYVKQQTAKP